MQVFSSNQPSVDSIITHIPPRDHNGTGSAYQTQPVITKHTLSKLIHL